MKFVLALLAVLFLAGCEFSAHVESTSTPDGKTVSSSSPEKSLSPQEKVEELRVKAKKLGLDWRIFCVPPDELEDYQRYQAEAKPWGGSKEYSAYIEGGGRGWWGVQEKTPEDAAYALSKLIEGPENHPADHAPIFKSRAQGDCDFQTVLDSDHKTNTPCKKGL